MYYTMYALKSQYFHLFFPEKSSDLSPAQKAEPAKRRAKNIPCHTDRGVSYRYSVVRMHIFVSIRVFPNSISICVLYAIFYLRILIYLHSSLTWFIGFYLTLSSLLKYRFVVSLFVISSRTSFNNFLYPPTHVGGEDYVYVGVPSSVSIFCNFTQIIVLTSSHFVGRFYRSAVTLSEYSTLLFGCAWLPFRQSPHFGKESSLFVPSFPFFRSPRPCGTLPTPSASNLVVHRTVLSLFTSEITKHFLLVSFFCTFIIAHIFDLSRGF